MISIHDPNYPGSEIALRRYARFFSDGGICERFFERRGDRLIEFNDVANYLTDSVPGLSRGVVTRRFLFSAKCDVFGRHGRRQVIANLIDLSHWRERAAGRYSLRPSYTVVESRPEQMRAPRSIWAAWIEACGWPIPVELRGTTLIEGNVEAVEMSAGPKKAKRAKAKSNAGRKLDPDEQYAQEMAQLRASGKSANAAALQIAVRVHAGNEPKIKNMQDRLRKKFRRPTPQLD